MILDETIVMSKDQLKVHYREKSLEALREANRLLKIASDYALMLQDLEEE